MAAYNVSAGYPNTTLNYKREVPSRCSRKDRRRKDVGHVLWYTRIRGGRDSENGTDETTEAVTELADRHNGSDTKDGCDPNTGNGTHGIDEETRQRDGLYRPGVSDHEDGGRSVQNLCKGDQDEFGTDHRSRCC